MRIKGTVNPSPTMKKKSNVDVSMFPVCHSRRPKGRMVSTGEVTRTKKTVNIGRNSRPHWASYSAVWSIAAFVSPKTRPVPLNVRTTGMARTNSTIEAFMRAMLRVYSVSLPLPRLMPTDMMGSATITTARLASAIRQSTTNSQATMNSIAVSADTASGMT